MSQLTSKSDTRHRLRVVLDLYKQQAHTHTHIHTHARTHCHTHTHSKESVGCSGWNDLYALKHILRVPRDRFMFLFFIAHCIIFLILSYRLQLHVLLSSTKALNAKHSVLLFRISIGNRYSHINSLCFFIHSSGVFVCMWVRLVAIKVVLKRVPFCSHQKWRSHNVEMCIRKMVWPHFFPFQVCYSTLWHIRALDSSSIAQQL